MCIQIDFQAFGMFHATVHLSCIKISTVFKQTEPNIHFSPFTYEYQQERPKWFLRLWCIRHKLCTYLAPKLTISPNRPKQNSICHTSSSSSIGCIQIDFQAYGMFHANRAPTLHKDQHYLQTGRTNLPLEHLHPRVPNTASKMVSQTTVHQAQTVHLSCVGYS